MVVVAMVVVTMVVVAMLVVVTVVVVGMLAHVPWVSQRCVFAHCGRAVKRPTSPAGQGGATRRWSSLRPTWTATAMRPAATPT
jgi:hypothetical protein